MMGGLLGLVALGSLDRRRLSNLRNVLGASHSLWRRFSLRLGGSITVFFMQIYQT